MTSSFLSNHLIEQETKHKAHVDNLNGQHQAKMIRVLIRGFAFIIIALNDALEYIRPQFV